MSMMASASSISFFKAHQYFMAPQLAIMDSISFLWSLLAVLVLASRLVLAATSLGHVTFLSQGSIMITSGCFRRAGLGVAGSLKGGTSSAWEVTGFASA